MSLYENMDDTFEFYCKSQADKMLQRLGFLWIYPDYEAGFGHIKSQLTKCLDELENDKKKN